MKRLLNVLAGLVGVAVLAHFAVAQSGGSKVSIEPRKSTAAPKEEDKRGANIRIDTNLVLIPVTVMDPLNRVVTGLERDHFRIYEDKVEQKIAQFASEDAPLSVGLVFDASGSMGAKLS